MPYQRVVLYLLLVTAALAVLAPILIMASTSLKPMAEIRDGNLFALPQAPTLEAWSTAWHGRGGSGGLADKFLNSFFIVIPALVLSVGLGAITGYALSLWRLRHANLLFAALLIGLFIPPQVTLYPMILLVRELGLFGTVPGLVLVHVVWGLAFVTLLFRNFFQSVPADLVKAARIDGAGFLATFWYVMLPLSLPVFAVAVILQFTYTWNDFLLGLTFSSRDSQPVTVALNNLVASQFGEQEYNVNMAATMLVALPTVLVYLFSGRLFVRGIAAGAVKG
ncbi:carbohydrate ABC transporter permease [Azospirillum halopraeferens]|uniref:carbohydrate ABC transporter permease n=1 Tax=Azospirillum halopraeferens TaxID=34010 RepID=UPI00040E7EE7|nr:carbohydrate ABC transporter permease [Azospirillum halopraeferens]